MSLNPAVRDWRGQSVWVVGASTGIGRATAAALHARGARVFVSARQGAALDLFVAQHPGAVALVLDVTDQRAVTAAFARIVECGGLDHVVYCAGHYSPLRASDIGAPTHLPANAEPGEAVDSSSPAKPWPGDLNPAKSITPEGFLDAMLRHEQVNYGGALMVLAAVLPYFLQRAKARAVAPGPGPDKRAGHISLVASVAGYRGLPQSLAYGPTKAALINLAETLYLDLQASGIAVSVINPGFVATPLTAANPFPMPALISAEQAAVDILAGWERGEFEIHFPKRFTGAMKLLSLMPYSWYFPLVRRLTGL